MEGNRYYLIGIMWPNCKQNSDHDCQHDYLISDSVVFLSITFEHFHKIAISGKSIVYSAERKSHVQLPLIASATSAIA